MVQVGATARYAVGSPPQPAQRGHPARAGRGVCSHRRAGRLQAASPTSSPPSIGAGYASATVRNELAALEEDGLIYQPHISAGRMPTDLGYRYFVERLMGESQLSLEEQRLIRHQFYQVQHQLDEWVRLTASVMAQALQSAAVITPPRGADRAGSSTSSCSRSTRRRADRAGAGRWHGAAGAACCSMRPIDQEELSQLARRLNERLAGPTPRPCADALRQMDHDSDQRRAADRGLAGPHAATSVAHPARRVLSRGHRPICCGAMSSRAAIRSASARWSRRWSATASSRRSRRR